MSGIVAMVRTDGAPVPPELVQQLTSALAFRGPDAQASRCLGQAALGHSLLSIGARTAHNRQPLTMDGTSWIVADARIDDRASLIASLDFDARRPPNSDAALILGAFMKWDVACLGHLLGDFTFAIWDERARRLLCACDHLGVRTLFYAQVGPWLAVSNAIDCLRRLPDVSDDLDDLAVADFLLFGHRADPAATTFREIRRLPPAHRLTWTPENGLDIRRYWELPIEDPLYCKDAEYAARLRALLDEAVSDRIRTERAAIFLSGGLDSTAIAATAVRQNRSPDVDPVRGFTFVHQSLIADDEGEAAAAAAAHLGIPWRHYVVDASSGWDDFATADTPEPFLASMDGEARARCYSDVAAHSRIVLDGEGADNLLIYEWRTYLSYLWRERRFARIAADALTFMAHRQRLPRLATLFARAAPIDVKPGKPQIPAWMPNALVERLQLRDRWNYVMRDAISDHPVRPIAYFSLQLPAWQSAFEGYDAGYARVPFEVSYPFLDVRVLRFLMRVPVVPWCRDKYLLGYAFRDELPPAVRNRPKTPLRGHPHQEKVRRDGVPRLVSSVRLEAYASPRASSSVPGSPSDVDAALRLVALSRWLAHLESTQAAGAPS